MELKENLQVRDDELSNTDATSVYPHADVEAIFQKEGQYDGRLFSRNDRATYTFLDDDAVICLHFDLGRSELFLNGTRVVTYDQHEKLVEYLTKFKKALLLHEVSSLLLRAMDVKVSQIFTQGDFESEEAPS